jgi:predicted nucleic acid-binding protein
MKLFFDTSALIKRYISENGSPKVDELFEAADTIIISPITKLEAYSTIKRLLKTGVISEEDYIKLKENIGLDFKHFDVLTLNKKLEEKAVKLIDKYQLKTLDSIQLASCLSRKEGIMSFVVCDEKLKNAAKLEALEVLDPTEIEPENDSED